MSEHDTKFYHDMTSLSLKDLGSIIHWKYYSQQYHSLKVSILFILAIFIDKHVFACNFFIITLQAL